MAYDENLTEEIKRLALSLGADKVGIGEAERADKTPMFFASPFSFIKDAKAVVSFCLKYPEGSLDFSKEDFFVILSSYASVRESMLKRLNEIALALSRELEKKGYKATPLEANLPVDERRWVSCLLSHRYLAQISGLGDIGVNNLLITPEWGPRVELGSVITNAPLKPDGPRLAGRIYEETCKTCFKCVEACPTQALTREKVPPYNFELNRCLWATQGWLMLSKIEIPPEEWITARPTSMVMVPKYTAKYPFIKVYQESQKRKMDFPCCNECILACPVGKK
ncbi:MAG: hypothetical protein DSO02_03785 [Hadesarchaea archaeon]|nr:MAG: hypothetical protein DSO02_03785 [Hadesarchaea archaeon]